MRTLIAFLVISLFVTSGNASGPDGAVLEGEQQPFILNAALSGGWFEPATSGQGFVLEVLPEVPAIIAGWFTFARENESGNRWFTLEGDYVDNVGTLTIYQSTGGTFDDPANVDTVAVGSALLTFFDCTSAELEYQFEDGLSGTIPLQRLVGAELCESLSTVGEEIPDEFSASKSAAFINVNLVSMVDNLVRPEHVVVVSDGVIQAVGPVGQVPIPPDAVAIDASGLYLGPGMTEMHQHQSFGGVLEGIQAGTLLIATGVTSVLSMGNSFSFNVPGLGAQFESGNIIGPTLYAGNVAFGPDDNAATTVETPGQATQFAQRLANEGYDFIKEYWFLTPDVLAQFEIESQRLNLPIIGHIPRTRPMSESLSKGHRMAAHIQEPFVTFMQSQINPNLINAAAQVFVDNGTWLTPTLAVFDSYVRISGGNQAGYNALLEVEGAEFTPQTIKTEWNRIYNADFVQAGQPGDLDPLYNLFELMTKRFFDAGVPLLLGTDAPTYPGLVSGFAIYKEMELLQKAGISPAEIYGIATRNAGVFIDETLGPDIGFGTIEVGKRADLILTQSNPLNAIANVRRPHGVMAGGQFWSREYLDSQLAALTQTVNSKVAGQSQPNACLHHLADLRALVAEQL